MNGEKPRGLVAIIPHYELQGEHEQAMAERRPSQLGPSDVRAKSLELRAQGLDNEEIREHFPEELHGSVAAYLAHETRGTYQDREIPLK